MPGYASARAVSGLLHRAQIKTLRRGAKGFRAAQGVLVTQEDNNTKILVSLSDPEAAQHTIHRITQTLIGARYDHTIKGDEIMVTGRVSGEEGSTVEAQSTGDYESSTNEGDKGEEDLGVTTLSGQDIRDEGQEEVTRSLPEGEPGQPKLLVEAGGPVLDERMEADGTTVPPLPVITEEEAARVFGIDNPAEFRRLRDLYRRTPSGSALGPIYPPTEEELEHLPITPEALANRLGLPTGLIERHIQALHLAHDTFNSADSKLTWLNAMRCVTGFHWEEHGIEIDGMEDWGPKLAEHIRRTLTW